MPDSKNNIVSYTAVFVAFLALMVSLYEGCQIRQHNRLSLRPLIDTKIFMSENKVFRLEIENAGLGPAIFKDFQILANGKEVNNWNEAMDEIRVRKFSKLNNLSSDEVFPKEESTVLLKIDTVLRPFNLQFTLTYESLYGERFVLKESF